MKQNYIKSKVTHYGLKLTSVILLTLSIMLSSELQAQCTADAGTITADATPVSLVSGSATISATP
ncbi:MAG: hypothetical protein HRU50_03920, partial [Winogradskyella sp.]|uniref:hypothetical protein n=1 Tax=Winogradskyella sp. TaxID=1883156 RepID=UPI0025E68F4D